MGDFMIVSIGDNDEDALRTLKIERFFTNRFTEVTSAKYVSGLKPDIFAVNDHVFIPQ